jgi:hypothetical protein
VGRVGSGRGGSQLEELQSVRPAASRQAKAFYDLNIEKQSVAL